MAGPDENCGAPTATALAELDALVGLASVKAEVHALMARLKAEQSLKAQGFAVLLDRTIAAQDWRVSQQANPDIVSLTLDDLREAMTQTT